VKQKRRERIDRGVKVRSDDIFALTSYREMLYVTLPPAIPVICLLVAPLFLPLYWQKVVISACVFALLAMSWDFLVSVGMVSLGQALFFGVGAYVAGSLDVYFGWPIWLTIPLATFLGGAFCALLLLPVLRLRGVYFAMVTLVLPLMLERVIEATAILGGTEGLTGLRPFPSVSVELVIITVAVLVCLFGFRRLMNTDYGLVLKAIKDNDRSVMSSGINIYWMKFQALFVAGSVGAFAGAYMTHVYQFVGMPAFALDYSILPVAAAVVGGTGTYAGAMLGAFVLVGLLQGLPGLILFSFAPLLPEHVVGLLTKAVDELHRMRTVIYAVSLVVFVVALPEGIFHYIQRKYQQFERWVEVEK